MMHNKYSDTDNMVVLVHKCLEILTHLEGIKVSVVYSSDSRYGMMHAVDVSC